MPKHNGYIIAHIPPYRWKWARVIWPTILSFHISHIKNHEEKCQWFTREMGQYEQAVKDTLADKDYMHQITMSISRSRPTELAYTGAVINSMPLELAHSTILMIANHLEHMRFWNKWNKSHFKLSWGNRRYSPRYDRVVRVATGLALNPHDNLQSVSEASSLVRLIAAALNREFRPWYKNPHWHIHHWVIHWHGKRIFRKAEQDMAKVQVPSKDLS